MGDIQRIQEGTETHYNSQLRYIARSNDIQDNWIWYRRNPGIQNVICWIRDLQGFHNQLRPLITPEEEKELDKVKIDSVPPTNIPSMVLLHVENRYRQMCNVYEGKLLFYFHKKGLGMKAGQDPHNVITRNL